MTDINEPYGRFDDLAAERDDAVQRGATTRPETDLAEGNASRFSTEDFRNGDDPDAPVLLP